MRVLDLPCELGWCLWRVWSKFGVVVWFPGNHAVNCRCVCEGAWGEVWEVWEEGESPVIAERSRVREKTSGAQSDGPGRRSSALSHRREVGNRVL